MSVLSPTTQKQVENSLVSNGLLTDQKLGELRTKSQKEQVPLFSLVVSDGKVSDEALTKTIAQVTRVPYVNLSNARIDTKTLELLSRDIAERYMAVPLGEVQNRLAVGMLDADNVQAVDFLANKIGRPLKVYAASEEGIRQVLHQYEADVEKDVGAALGTTGEEIEAGFKADEERKTKDKEARKTSIATIVQDSIISKAVSTILEYAAKNRASDIHVEPLEKELKIRCRIDGVLREIMKLPKSTEPPLVSRIKILSNLKIDEHRIPQDGQFSIKVDGQSL